MRSNSLSAMSKRRTNALLCVLQVRIQSLMKLVECMSRHKTKHNR